MPVRLFPPVIVSPSVTPIRLLLIVRLPSGSGTKSLAVPVLPVELFSRLPATIELLIVNDGILLVSRTKTPPPALEAELPVNVLLNRDTSPKFVRIPPPSPAVLFPLRVLLTKEILAPSIPPPLPPLLFSLRVLLNKETLAPLIPPPSRPLLLPLTVLSTKKTSPEPEFIPPPSEKIPMVLLPLTVLLNNETVEPLIPAPSEPFPVVLLPLICAVDQVGTTINPTATASAAVATDGAVDRRDTTMNPTATARATAGVAADCAVHQGDMPRPRGENPTATSISGCVAADRSVD